MEGRYQYCYLGIRERKCLCTAIHPSSCPKVWSASSKLFSEWFLSFFQKHPKLSSNLSQRSFSLPLSLEVILSLYWAEILLTTPEAGDLFSSQYAGRIGSSPCPSNCLSPASCKILSTSHSRNKFQSFDLPPTTSLMISIAQLSTLKAHMSPKSNVQN